jgi:hypothetical protein
VCGTGVLQLPGRCLSHVLSPHLDYFHGVGDLVWWKNVWQVQGPEFSPQHQEKKKKKEKYKIDYFHYFESVALLCSHINCRINILISGGGGNGH